VIVSTVFSGFLRSARWGPDGGGAAIDVADALGIAPPTDSGQYVTTSYEVWLKNVGTDTVFLGASDTSSTLAEDQSQYPLAEGDEPFHAVIPPNTSFYISAPPETVIDIRILAVFQ
jgi:hypothetical protein